MSICSSVEDIRRRGVESQRAQKPLAVTPDVTYYAKALRAKMVTPEGVPERLRNAVQECLLLMYETRKR